MKTRAYLIKPGDLVVSPRTKQMMLILSTLIRKEDGRIQITWMNQGKTNFFIKSGIMCTDVDPDLIYYLYDDQDAQAKTKENKKNIAR
jgi:hypothetical protein